MSSPVKSTAMSLSSDIFASSNSDDYDLDDHSSSESDYLESVDGDDDDSEGSRDLFSGSDSDYSDGGGGGKHRMNKRSSKSNRASGRCVPAEIIAVSHVYSILQYVIVSYISFLRINGAVMRNA